MATAERPLLSAPPHNIEAEVSVLGAILLSDKPMYQLVIEDALVPEDFYREQHRVIFGVMRELYDEGEPIDSLTVTERLRMGGRLEEAGGDAGVAALAGSVPAAGNLRHYAQIVKENALMRRLLTTAHGIQASVLGHEAAPRELVERAERAMLEVAHDDRRQDFRRIDDILNVELDKLHRLSLEHTSLTGVPSGFDDLDNLTGGFQPGNLVVIAARPSMGKSCLVTNIAENAALGHARPVALFSLEMSEAGLAMRFIASQARVKGEDLSKGRAEKRWPKIVEATSRLASAPISVDDSSDLGILELRAKARRLHAQADGGLGVIIVDYLQLMRTDLRTENRAEQVGALSRGLKILARELNVPVLALSQLNRGVEARTDKRPLLSDLRESGAIEQDSDLVIFIYRDEYYNKEESEHPGEAELLITKHRNGPLGTVRLVFQSEYPRFMTMARDRVAACVPPAPWSCATAAGSSSTTPPTSPRRAAAAPPGSTARGRAACRRWSRSAFAACPSTARPSWTWTRRSCASSVAMSRRSTATSTRAAVCGSPATSAPARPRWPCSCPAPRSTPGARSPSTRFRACWRRSARPSTRAPSARTSTCWSGLPRSTCFTSTTSAPSAPATGSSSSCTRSSTRATRTSAPW